MTISDQLPLVEEVAYCQPCSLYARFAEQPWSMLLDSSKISERWGRYSFIGVDPFLKLVIKDDLIKFSDGVKKGNPFVTLKNLIGQYSLSTMPELPPFQGGVAGYFSYDLVRCLEDIPSHAVDDLQFPDMALGFFDLVVAFDHLQEKTWIFSSGFPETDIKLRRKQARQRLDWVKGEIDSRSNLKVISKVVCDNNNVVSNFPREDYLLTIKKVVDYIYAGDIFEANISQRFQTNLPPGLSSFQLYTRMQEINSAPFSAYLNLGDFKIASASPERFLKLTSSIVETCPIKGTRPRSANKEIDDALAKELMESEKDIAENVMIVDLMRNDLSRVCEPHSVEVKQLCGLESFATVHHLVSVVNGKLEPGNNGVDLLAATFPGGSITGAPKIRAMEIIAELEPTARGPYCGSIGYIGFDGNLDTSIVIRTYLIKDNWVTFQAGGAIVADSNPESEYEETLDKARALRKALIQPGGDS